MCGCRCGCGRRCGRSCGCAEFCLCLLVALIILHVTQAPLLLPDPVRHTHKRCCMLTGTRGCNRLHPRPAAREFNCARQRHTHKQWNCPQLCPQLYQLPYLITYPASQPTPTHQPASLPACPEHQLHGQPASHGRLSPRTRHARGAPAHRVGPGRPRAPLPASHIPAARAERLAGRLCRRARHHARG